tara:strand:- start:3333 stop:4454 length:1122 start_codon:yes stop_codon:yes gene_type:complete
MNKFRKNGYVILIINLLFSAIVFSSEIELLQDINIIHDDHINQIGLIQHQYKQSMDILDYKSHYAQTKLNEASTESFFISHVLKNRFRLSAELGQSSNQIQRNIYPYEINTNSDNYSVSIGSSLIENKSYNISFEIFQNSEKQDSLNIDCYQFGSQIIGGSCAEAEIRFIDAEQYRKTGVKSYNPILRIEGKSKELGITIRVKDVIQKNFMINHSLRLSRAKIHINYISDLLDTTDNFILGSRVGSSSIEEIINNFKTQLPQKDPWHENQLRYTLSILYKINNSFTFTTQLGALRVSRSNYIKSPYQKDLNSNITANLSLNYRFSETITAYGMLALSNHYLLGLKPLSYNRKSVSFFDHPYGELHMGIVFNIK